MRKRAPSVPDEFNWIRSLFGSRTKQKLGGQLQICTYHKSVYRIDTFWAFRLVRRRQWSNMATGLAILMVFIGCCTNVVSLELLVRSVTNLDSGPLNQMEVIPVCDLPNIMYVQWYTHHSVRERILEKLILYYLLMLRNYSGSTMKPEIINILIISDL